MNLFDSVRSSAQRVMSGARFVRIVDARVNEYALSLPIETLSAPALDPSSHFIGSADETLAFFVTLDAINFGSGYFPHLSKLPGKSGYFTVATHLTKHFRARGPMPAHELSDLNAARCREIFHQSAGNGPVDELMAHFAKALNDLGQLLLRDFDGSFTRLIESAEHSAEKLVALFSRMPMFRDVQSYRGDDVPFYKRAQLTAADLHLALNGQGLGRFDDLHRLTIFADNLVPHVLRCDGVLEYDAALASRIDAGKLIQSGSEEEIEIRAAAVHASERIVHALQITGKSVTAMQLDYLLWNRGQQPDYKSRPRHRARSVFY